MVSVILFRPVEHLARFIALQIENLYRSYPMILNENEIFFRQKQNQNQNVLHIAFFTYVVSETLGKEFQSAGSIPSSTY